MPADFERCVKSGGRVRTEKPSADTYQYVCYKGGKKYYGEVHKVKSKYRKKRNRR